jgi:hypothetical protein
MKEWKARSLLIAETASIMEGASCGEVLFAEKAHYGHLVQALDEAWHGLAMRARYLLR